MILVALLFVLVVAIVAVGLARPRPLRQAPVDVVFRTRLEAADVELRAADRQVAGALIAAR